MKANPDKVKEQIAIILAAQKEIDVREKRQYLELTKEREKLDNKLQKLIISDLASSVAVAIQDENFSYSDYEQEANHSNGEPYMFSVSLDRKEDDLEDEDEKCDDKVKPKAKSKQRDSGPKSYDDIVTLCRTYKLRQFDYKNCTVRFRPTSMEVSSERSREAVFDLLSEWRVPVNLADFLSEIEGLESKLKIRRECLDKLQTSMLFTVGK